MTSQDPIAGDLFGGEGGGGGGFDLMAFLSAARRFWWIIAIGGALGLGAGIAMVKFSEPSFIATAEFKIERRATSSRISLSGMPSAFEGATTPEDLKTTERSFVNPLLLERIAEKILSGDVGPLSINGVPAGDMTANEIATAIGNACFVKLIPDTRLIEISFTDRNPETAKIVANLLVEEGIAHEQDQRIKATDASIRYLREEVKKFEENLRASEEKLNTYTRTLGNVSIDNDLNIVANQLRDLNTRLTAAKAERLRLEGEYEQVREREGNVDRLLEVESIRSLPAVVQIEDRVADARGKLEKLSLRYRENSPFIQQAKSELAGLEEALREEILAAPKAIGAQLAVARDTEENLRREQQLQEEKVIQVRDLSVPSRVLQREIDADRQAFEAALKRLSEEVSFARNQPVLLQMVKPAGMAWPAGPSPLRTVGVAVFAGTVLGLGGVLLLMQLDTSLRTGDDAARALDLPVVAVVPKFEPPEHMPQGAHAQLYARFPTLGAAGDPAAEAFRGLRAAIRSRAEQGKPCLIGLAGSVPGEGATFCSVNLAVAFAQAGQRTLLVDANFREPSIEASLFESRGRPGLSGVLDRSTSLSRVIHASPVPLLDVVPSGAAPELPAEALGRERFWRFLEAVQPYYDAVIVDAAPVARYSDALGFARLLTFFCLVVGCGKTPRDAPKRATELLRNAGARPFGLVANNAPKGTPKVELEPAKVPPVTGAQPISCPVCGKRYGSFGAWLDATVSAPGVEGVRRCSCGAEFAPSPSANARDESPLGTERREAFGRLLDALIAGGIPEDQAREHLLLTLRVLRNEADGAVEESDTPASHERAKLLSDTIQILGRGGLKPEEAGKVLSATIESWRKAP